MAIKNSQPSKQEVCQFPCGGGAVAKNFALHSKWTCFAVGISESAIAMLCRHSIDRMCNQIDRTCALQNVAIKSKSINEEI